MNTKKVVILFFLLLCQKHQLAKSFNVDLSTDEIIINKAKDHQIIIFGNKGPQESVIITIDGPRNYNKNIVIKRKNYLGIPITQEKIAIQVAPSFYYVSSEKPLHQSMQHKKIPTITIQKNKNSKHSHQSIRNKFIEHLTAQNLYQDKEGVMLVSPNGSLFKEIVSLPPNLPIGPYSIEITCLENNSIKHIFHKTLWIKKIGINEIASRINKTSPALYTFIVMVIAVCLGFCIRLINK